MKTLSGKNRLWRVLPGVILLLLAAAWLGRAAATNWLALAVTHRITAHPSLLFSAMPPAEVEKAILPVQRARLLADWQLAEGNYERAEETLEEGLSAAVDDPLLLALEGEASAGLGLQEAALSQWIRAGAFQPILRRGQAAYQSGDFETAQVYYAAAWQIVPADAQLVEAWVKVYQSRGDLPGAERLLQGAIRLYPGKMGVNWRIRLGDILRLEKKWVEAEEQYRAALVLSPGSEPAALGLALSLYYGKSRFEEALDLVKQVIQHAPDPGSAYGTLGELYRAEKLYEQSLAAYAQQTELQPENFWSVVSQAEILNEMGLTQSAIQMIETAISRFSEQPHAYYLLALFHRKLGELGPAIAMAEKSVALDQGKNKEYILALARLYQKNNQISQAIAAYEQILRLDPSDAEIAAILENLKK